MRANPTPFAPSSSMSAGRRRSRGWKPAATSSRRDLVLQVPRHYGVGRGTFALRSPARPNPIAMSVARLLRVEGTRLSVVGLDCLDETPLLDIKPYFASTDAVADAVVGWHAARE
jgi:tRNA (Thr-GGU) A37 N-methylase